MKQTVPVPLAEDSKTRGNQSLNELAIPLHKDYNPLVLDVTTDTPLKTSRKKLVRTRLSIGLAVVDILAITVAFMMAGYLRLGPMSNAQLSNLLIACLPIYLGIAFNVRAYGTTVLGSFWVSYSRASTALIGTMSAILLTMFLLKASAEYSRIVFALGTVVALTLLFFGRWAMSKLAKRLLGGNPMAEVVIHDGVEAVAHNKDVHMVDAVNENLHPDLGDPVSVQRLGLLTRDIDRVIVHCSTDRRHAWASALKALDIHAEIVTPELKELSPIGLDRRGDHIALMVSQGPLKWNERLSKRLFDIVFSMLALPLLAIPMLIVAIAIKIESPGPVFFRQKRIGLGNRPFDILKFRSMRAEQCDANGDRSTGRDDDRTTRIGAFIRKTSIDELPQLFNVLAGSMSIVGPRPHAIGSRAENLLFWDIDKRYWRRHTIKPGLTGLAQVMGFRGATEKREDLESRLQADLDYRANWSLWGDIKIILMTFRVLVHRNAF